jgi:DNA-directed RNA polymerase subunit RPC12/RpoP
MTTWKCHDCESQFYEPDTVLYCARRCGNGSENWQKEEYIDVCPVCGSDEIYEAYLCDYCEKEVGEGELDEDDLCFECRLKAENANLKADNRSLVEQMNKMAMRMEHKSGTAQRRKA